MDITPTQLIQIGVIIIGSGGIVGGVISAATLVSSRLDKYRERQKTKLALEVSESAKLKRIEIDQTEKLYARLDTSNAALRGDNEDLKKQCIKCGRVIKRSIGEVRRIMRQLRIVLSLITARANENDIVKETDILENDLMRLEVLLSGYDEE